MSFSNRNGGSTTPTMLSSLNLDHHDQDPTSTAIPESFNPSSSSGTSGSSYVQGSSEDLAADQSEVVMMMNLGGNKSNCLSERLSECQASLRAKERMLRKLGAEQEDQLGILCR